MTHLHYSVWLLTIMSHSYALQPTYKVRTCFSINPLNCGCTKTYSNKFTQLKVAADVWICLFGCKLAHCMSFMSLKRSDTERCSQWQRPAFAKRDLWGLQRANTWLHVQWRVINTCRKKWMLNLITRFYDWCSFTN